MNDDLQAIYRAMGYAWCRHRRQPMHVKQVRRYLLPAEKADDWNWWTRIPDAEVENYEIEYAGPDPLTDWSAFGEILEWAEKWADERDYRIQDALTWENFDGRYQRGWVVSITKGQTLIARADALDFRTAVLAALESAIRRGQP